MAAPVATVPTAALAPSVGRAAAPATAAGRAAAPASAALRAARQRPQYFGQTYFGLYAGEAGSSFLSVSGLGRLAGLSQQSGHVGRPASPPPPPTLPPRERECAAQMRAEASAAGEDVGISGTAGTVDTART